jgi:hypothetical protein
LEDFVVVDMTVSDEIDVVVVENLLESLLPCYARFAAR